MLDALPLPFVQRGLVEILLLSVGAGLLGTWIVLRGLTFYSHAVGTAAFPGLVLADGLGFSPPLGAFAAAPLVRGRRRRARARGARALRQPRPRSSSSARSRSGVLLASDVFHSGASVDTLLFGSLLLIGPRDLALAAAASAAALVATLRARPPLARARLRPRRGPRARRALARCPTPSCSAWSRSCVVAALSAVGRAARDRAVRRAGRDDAAADPTACARGSSARSRSPRSRASPDSGSR